MTSTFRRVALLEDDPSQAHILLHWLISAGFVCSRYELGQSLLHALRHESFEALVVDWSLPDIDGLEVLKQVRRTLRLSVPILLVSARADEADIVTALNQGADDYMIKPVRRRELLVRLETIRRRSGGVWRPAEPQVITRGALRLHCGTRTAWLGDRQIHLTAKDFELAAVVLLNQGRLLSRAELREAVWGRGAPVSSRTLDTHISRIRDKLELTPSNGWRLAAVYGHGYRLQQVPVSAGHDTAKTNTTLSPQLAFEHAVHSNVLGRASPGEWDRGGL